MKELTKTRRLTIASIIFIFILMIGFITFRSPDFVYKKSAEETLNELSTHGDVVSFGKIGPILPDSNRNYVWVDVRNSYAYNKATIKGAINIPVSDILDDEAIGLFENWNHQSKTVILFGEDQREANAPWMILKQIGYDNIKVMAGGFSLFGDKTADQGDIAKTAYDPEKPIMDFAGYIEKISGEKVNTTKSESVNILPVRRNKKSVTAGGC